MPSSRQTLLYFITIVSTFLIAACGSADQATANQAEPDAVSFQTAWVDTIEYSGFYMAEENDYYAEENIALEIKPFEIGVSDPIVAVTSGEATFGVVGADKLMLARQDGQPLVAIATIYQRSPIVFLSLAENNITNPEDLVGKTVLVNYGGTTDVVFPAMLDNLGIPVEDVNITGRTDFSNDALLNGDVDVMDAFVTNQLVQLEEDGYELNYFLVSDYGIEMYANVIFTTEEMIENNPDVVQRFLAATLKGLQDTVDDPDKAAELAVARNESLSLELETESMLASVPLITSRNNPPGMMFAEDWEVASGILVEQDVLDGAADVHNAYTMQFLDEIYGDE